MEICPEVEPRALDEDSKAQIPQSERILRKVEEIIPKLFREYYGVTETYKPGWVSERRIAQIVKEALNSEFFKVYAWDNFDKLDKFWDEVYVFVRPLYRFTEKPEKGTPRVIVFTGREFLKLRYPEGGSSMKGKKLFKNYFCGKP